VVKGGIMWDLRCTIDTHTCIINNLPQQLTIYLDNSSKT